MSTVFLKNIPPTVLVNICPPSSPPSFKVLHTIHAELRFGQIICQALMKLHEKGLIFGNLHPDCVLIDPETITPKLIGLEYLSHINKN